jgi:cytoskeleton protein RodZ
MMPLVEQLRRARERVGLSIEDLSARTKIQIPLLEAVERGDFEHVPRGIFVRGFLRAYAKEVGLDPEAVVMAYLEQYEPDTLVPEPAAAPNVEVSEHVILADADEDAFSVRKLWPVAAVTVLVVGIFMTVGSGSRNSSAVAEAQAVGTSGTPEPAPAPAPRPIEGLSLDIHPKRDVWVAATADGQRVVYRTVTAGEHVTVTARREISARVGDAEAFEYSVNGVAGQSLGKPAEVRDILITAGSFRTFKVERPAPQAPKPSQTPQVPQS